jgi:histidyl-tRNA synthetase
VPTAVLVAVNDEADRTASNQVAAALRGRGIPTEVAPSAAKFGKQIKHADRRGIPYVWFDQTEAGTPEVRDIRSGDQVAADAERWAPPAADLLPTILTAEELP